MTVPIRRLGAALTVAATLTAALNPAQAADQRLEQAMETAYRGTGRLHHPPKDSTAP